MLLSLMYDKEPYFKNSIFLNIPPEKEWKKKRDSTYQMVDDEEEHMR